MTNGWIVPAVILLPNLLWLLFPLPGAAASEPIVLLLACVLYYGCWGRYIYRKRDRAVLYRPLWGLPLPMNVLPVIYFLSASLLLDSVWLAVAAIIFGVAHVYMGRFEYRQIEQSRAGK